MGGLHWWDMVPLVVLALLFFGPKRLPEMGSSVGKTIKEFQKSMHEITEPKSEATPAALPLPTESVAPVREIVAPTATVTPMASAAPVVTSEVVQE